LQSKEGTYIGWVSAAEHRLDDQSERLSFLLIEGCGKVKQNAAGVLGC